MGLDDPTKKMSKSAKSEWNYIALTDDPARAKKKIMKATTDSDMEVKYDPEKKPGVSNLLIIESLLSKISIEDLEKKYKGKMYGDFKKGVARVVEQFLLDFQARYDKISNEEIENIFNDGVKNIEPIAKEIMTNVKKKIGIL
jgi:tryptophanyl-tRNA synthetase